MTAQVFQLDAYRRRSTLPQYGRRNVLFASRSAMGSMLGIWFLIGVRFWLAMLGVA